MTVDTHEEQAPRERRPGKPPVEKHATAVESHRAIAEVEAAAFLAKTYPRSLTTAIQDRDAMCARLRMAEQAFFAFPRGDGRVQGATVHLARALAQAWGNVQYGLIEIGRHPDLGRWGQSDMLAWAWDVQGNVRSTTVFVVPWVRDAKGRLVPLDNPRDVYENNANMGARRVREMIFAVLPPWYVDEAEDLCRATLANPPGEANVPLPQRRANAVDKWAELGVSQRQLETRVGRPVDEWLPTDLATLAVDFRSVQRRETTIGELFGPPQLRRQVQDVNLPDGPVGDDADPATIPDDAPLSENTARRLGQWFQREHLAGRSTPVVRQRMEVLQAASGDDAVTSIDDLTDKQGRELLERLDGLDDDTRQVLGLRPKGERP